MRRAARDCSGVDAKEVNSFISSSSTYFTWSYTRQRNCATTCHTCIGL